MNRRLLAIAGLLLLPLAAIGAVCGDSTTRIENAAPGDAATGITVAGEGKVSAPPDVAQISLGVSTLAPTVADARTQAATALTAMIDAMKTNGVAEKDIQTAQLNISPEYDYRENTSVLRGFRVTNTVNAKIRDIDKTGLVVDEAVVAGGDNVQIQGIYFTIDDPKELQGQARTAAVEDAREKAEALAAAGGVDVGEPISISEGVAYTPPIYYDRAGAATDSAAPAPETPINPGELDVTVTVTVVFGIQ